jgi:hypothetical protein
MNFSPEEKQGVCVSFTKTRGLAIYIKMYLKAKEE